MMKALSWGGSLLRGSSRGMRPRPAPPQVSCQIRPAPPQVSRSLRPAPPQVLRPVGPAPSASPLGLT